MPITPGEAPLILTAALDADSFAVLDGLRRRHFPKARNVVPAHVSLFHALPGAEIEAIGDALADLCARHRPFELEPVEAIFLGRGVGLRYAAPELDAIHAELSRRWMGWLSPQDRQRFRAHVTIQNKVEPAQARRLFETMRTSDPPPCRVEGLSLWHYRGGPWDAAGLFRFAESPTQ